jgi:hypothetical protein
MRFTQSPRNKSLFTLRGTTQGRVPCVLGPVTCVGAEVQHLQGRTTTVAQVATRKDVDPTD